MWLQQLPSTSSVAILSSLASRICQGKQCADPRLELKKAACFWPPSEPSRVPCRGEPSQRDYGPEPTPQVKVPEMQKTKLRVQRCPPCPQLARDVCESRSVFQLILKLVTNGFIVCYWTLRLFITQQQLIGTNAQVCGRKQICGTQLQREEERASLWLSSPYTRHGCPEQHQTACRGH